MSLLGVTTLPYVLFVGTLPYEVRLSRNLEKKISSVKYHNYFYNISKMIYFSLCYNNFKPQTTHIAYETAFPKRTEIIFGRFADIFR